MEIRKLPVYKLWLAKPTSEALQLPQERVAEASQKHAEYMARTGGRILIQADGVWSNEEFPEFGIEEFPSLEALIEFHDCLKELNWFNYFNSRTYLGWSINSEAEPVPFVPPPPPAAGTQPLYKVFLSRPTALSLEDPQGMAEIYAKTDAAAQRAGMVTILSAYARLNNEEWQGFGLQRYPDLDAFTEQYWLMEKLGWFKYMQAKSFLGRATGGLLAG